MCLLLVKPAESNFPDSFLKDVYHLNQDGIGVMYADNGKVIYKKIVPKSFSEVLAFWNLYIADRKCSVHFRMQTHGDIDELNAHPYEVISNKEGYQLFMMHNGILHTGNAKDIKRSDTWHYIQDYLRPMLLNNPEFFLTKEFSELVGSHIGNGNKFVFLDYLGNQVIINEDTFLSYNGCLLSNTYAWNTKGTEFDFSFDKTWKKVNNFKVSYKQIYSDIEYGESLERFLTDDERCELFKAQNSVLEMSEQALQLMTKEEISFLLS